MPVSRDADRIRRTQERYEQFFRRVDDGIRSPFTRRPCASCGGRVRWTLELRRRTLVTCCTIRRYTVLMECAHVHMPFPSMSESQCWPLEMLPRTAQAVSSAATFLFASLMWGLMTYSKGHPRARSRRARTPDVFPRQDWAATEYHVEMCFRVRRSRR